MTNILKLNYFFLALWLFLIHAAFLQAADLTFTPAVPIVEVNQTIVLSVQGTSGEVNWTAMYGNLQGEGTQVTYLAPSQAGSDVVTVLDRAGNVATVKIIITPFAMVSAEKAQWEVFSNLDMIQEIAWVKGSNTFLATTTGGLVQYEMATGDWKIFTTEDGLPDNQVTRFLADQGGVWIGTANGLAYYSNSTDALTRYDTPLGRVSDLIFDENDELWVSFSPNATDIMEITGGKKPGFSSEGNKMYAVAHLDVSKPVDQQWDVHPLDMMTTDLVDDQHGGVWLLGANGKDETFVLGHLSSSGEWAIYTTKALGLSGGFDLWSPEPDGQGGVWVGMKGYVVHFSLAGEWKIYSAKEAGLPEESSIMPIFMNKDGTLRLMILADESVFDLSENGTWTPVLIERPKGLLWSADDDKGGSWWLTLDRHLWYQDADRHWTAYPDSLNYPYSTKPFAGVHDGEGGAWVGTAGEGLVHLTKEGHWEKRTTPSKLPLLILGIGYDAKEGGWLLGFQFSMLFGDFDGVWGPTLIRCQPDKSELNCDPPEPNLPTQITTESSLPQLLADEKGGLWLSTSNSRSV